MSETPIHEDLIARPLKLAGLASYREHSIVSREIVKKATGTVTVFAFDAGEGLSEHTAPFDALVYALEGQGEIMISKVWHTVKEGEMIVMPANHPHAVNADKRFKMLLVLVK
ncbi:MAG: cupin domain-containing protein [Pseudomonadota bacterium]|nr:cupin domain-containing protein [Pseudomonadota bacterium]